MVGLACLRNNLKRVSSWLARYRGDLVGVVVQSTDNRYWLVDGFLEQGYPVHLANTVAIQQYGTLNQSPSVHNPGLRGGARASPQRSGQVH